MTFFSRALKVLVPIGLLVAGALIMLSLSKMRPTPTKKEVVVSRTPVQTVNAVAADGATRILAMGKTVPARQVTLQAEVGGRVVEYDPQFVAGGVVRADTTLVRIDERDYKLAIKNARASVKRAQVLLKTEESRKAVAEKEWDMVGDKASASARGRALALREPQMAGARADLQAARSQLMKTQLSLSRTRIKAPINAVVQSEVVEIGQLAGPGAALGTLIGTDEWWVEVSIPASELKWIKIPGSGATITQRLGDDTSVVRQGAVLRVLPDVNPTGLMARVIVEIKDPMALEEGHGAALLLGTTVQVDIEGMREQNVVAIPRRALREGDNVWVVADDQTLAVVKVDVVRRERERVLIRGLPSDSRIISSRIAAPIPGMSLAPSDEAGAVENPEAKPKLGSAGARR